MITLLQLRSNHDRIVYARRSVPEYLSLELGVFTPRRQLPLPRVAMVTQVRTRCVVTAQVTSPISYQFMALLLAFADVQVALLCRLEFSNSLCL